MKSVAAGVVCAVGVAILLGTGIGAQEQGATAGAADPRVGLKPGLKNAGQAARNLELVSSLPKPPGFYDPKMPAGEPTGPEVEAKPDAKPDVKPEVKPEVKPAANPPEPPKPPAPPRGSGLNFANSDLAFGGQHLFIGNFNGFNVYDLAAARKPKLLASIVCPGGQGDVSVHGNLLVMSVEQTRGRLDCGTQGVEPPVSAERFRGVRIFDVSDVRRPPTACPALIGWPAAARDSKPSSVDLSRIFSTPITRTTSWTPRASTSWRTSASSSSRYAVRASTTST